MSLPCSVLSRISSLVGMYRGRVLGAVLIGCSLVLSGAASEVPQICGGQPALGVPAWVDNGVIYEINVRQYSKAGNLAGVTSDLARLKTLGVDILWLMPIYPIGEANRKGPLGSYYSVKDYTAVNPEFGTEADFRQLVTTAHAQGMRVILDWVGNHTAWDNPLAKQHPDFYVHDAKGTFEPPAGTDWSDVIQLDFTNPGVLDYEYQAMAHWVKDFGVDGFRCDFATGVPTKFWDELTARLRQVRSDLFLLAESELPQEQLHAFNASYGWDMAHTFEAIAQGRSSASGIDDSLARTRVTFPAGAVLIRYTSNHDENSWNGTEFERFGGGTATFAVLSFVMDGIPLIYDGQESALNRRLKFFEHDPITWGDYSLTTFYHTLCDLRHRDPALRTGASMRRIATTKNESVYAMLREAEGHRVVAFLNLTARDTKADAYDPALVGHWRDVFTGTQTTLTATPNLELKAWEYRVLVSE